MGIEVVHILTGDDIPKIYDKIMWRQVNFNDENMVMSLGVVLMNMGDKYVRVRCTQGEFEGTKRDLPHRLRMDGIPLCPGGHPLFELTSAPKLALIQEENEDGR